MSTCTITETKSYADEDEKKKYQEKEQLDKKKEEEIPRCKRCGTPVSIDTDKNPPIDTLKDPPKNGEIAYQTASIFD